MKNNIIILVPLSFILLFFSCTKSVKIEEIPKIEKEKEVLPEKEIKPVELEREVEPDYNEVELRITKIQKLEEKLGSYNSYNPRFSWDERYIAVEANLEMLRKIYIYRLRPYESISDFGVTFEKIKEVYLEESSEDFFTEDFFESYIQESFNYEFAWFPESSSFIFTSNAGMGEYNIFLGSTKDDDSILSNITQRLHPKKFGDYYMMTEEVKKDGQAKVSPDGTRIVFTSGRTGNGDLYLLNLITGELKRLTVSEDTDLFPQWSPDGNDIVYTTGGKKSHDIHVIRNVDSNDGHDEVLVKWFFDDIMPKYSPDGKMVSFYTTYNKERDPFNSKRWGIMIIPSDGSAPKSGKELIQFFHIPDVVKDNVMATAWFPDSKHIIFAKHIDSDYNPIYIYNVETGEERFLETGTNINHDITVSLHGLVSFRAQVLGWDRIFIASTTHFQEYVKLNSHKWANVEF